MKNRDFWYLIGAVVAISYAIEFLELYGRVLLISVGILAFLVFFAKFVGPSLPAYLGGDPKPESIERPERELELYGAMVANEIDRASDCIARGADPFRPFTSHFRPSTTSANSCYDHAKSNPQLLNFRKLFETYKRGT